MSTAAPIGLLAGAGRFPVVFAEKARSLNLQVGCVGLQHLAPPELRDICTHYTEAGIAKWGRIARSFRKMGVKHVVMAGKVHKAALFAPARLWQLCPDWMALRF